MPTNVDRNQVQRLIEQGAQLLEVLPSVEYDDEHIAGAINIPLKKLDGERTRELQQDAPVITYCHDFQCDMSARAAWRLETLGFQQVYRYAAGKADWFAAGLPSEGKSASMPRARNVVRREVPTCSLDDRVGDVRERLRGSGWDQCIVVNEAHVVLGRLRGGALEAGAEVRAEELMEAGPTTTRPNERLQRLVQRLRARNVADIVVSDGDGRLLGVLYREDAERAVGDQLEDGEGEAACACEE